MNWRGRNLSLMGKANVFVGALRNRLQMKKWSCAGAVRSKEYISTKPGLDKFAVK